MDAQLQSGGEKRPALSFAWLCVEAGKLARNIYSLVPRGGCRRLRCPLAAKGATALLLRSQRFERMASF